MRDEQALEDSVLFCPHCRAAYRSGFARCPLDGAELKAEETDPLIGTTVGEQYTITRCMAYGATSRVYHAHHTRLRRRELAIKVLLGDLTATLPTRMRFAQEAEMLSRLDHPNVVSVVDFARTPEGLLYLVMDLANGPTLAELVRLAGPIPWRRAVFLAQQMCRGLAHAHAQDIVHRDFKPDNVIIEYAAGDEIVRIIDFGIALTPRDNESPRLTSLGFTLGTPAYAAPEQALNQAIDHRADLFALGVTLYEMLSGMLPFSGDARELLQHNAFHDAPAINERNPQVKVPDELEQVVRRLMARDPEERYQLATDVLHALDEVLEEVAACSGPIRRPSAPPLSTPSRITPSRVTPSRVTPSRITSSRIPPRAARPSASAEPAVSDPSAAPLGPVMVERLVRANKPVWPRALVGLALLGAGTYAAVQQLDSRAAQRAANRASTAAIVSAPTELDLATNGALPPGAAAPRPPDGPEANRANKVAPRARRPLDRRALAASGAAVAVVTASDADEPGDKLVTAAELTAATTGGSGPATPAQLDPQGEAQDDPPSGGAASPAGDAKITLAVAAPADAAAPASSAPNTAAAPANDAAGVAPAAANAPPAPAQPLPAATTVPASAPATSAAHPASAAPSAPSATSPASPKAAAAAATAMFLSGRELQVSGSLSPRTVERAVTRVARGLTACARHATAKSTKARFVIDERGRATAISVDGASAELGACLKTSLSGIRTETPPDVGTAEATLTLFFTPKASS